MPGAKNKKQRKKLKRFQRQRRKDMELKSLLTGSESAKELAGLYGKGRAGKGK